MAELLDEKSAELIEEKCSKCGGVLDRKGSPRWCKACRATYQRDYNDLRYGREEAKGFAAGVRQMREVLAGEFDRLGSGKFEGYEAAALIRQAPGPSIEP